MVPRAGASTQESTGKTRTSVRTETAAARSQAAAGATRAREETSTSALATDVHDKKEAIDWMVKSQYLIQGEEATPGLLAQVLKQMAVAIPKLTRQGVNGLRAAAYIIEGLELGQERAALVDAVRSEVETTLTAEVTQTIREVKNALEDIARVSDKLATAATDMASSATQGSQRWK